MNLASAAFMLSETNIFILADPYVNHRFQPGQTESLPETGGGFLLRHIKTPD